METAKLCILREQLFWLFSHVHRLTRSNLVMLATVWMLYIYSQIRQAITEAAPSLGMSRIICDHNLCNCKRNHNL
jgi:hypothetical protein